MVVPDKPGLEVNFDALSLGLEPGQLWPVYVMDAVDGAREDGVTHLCGARGRRRRGGDNGTAHQEHVNAYAHAA